MDVTLLELNLSDAEFNAPFAPGRRDDADDSAPPSGEGTARGSSMAPIMALLVLAALAVLARYLRSRAASDADADTAA